MRGKGQAVSTLQTPAKAFVLRTVSRFLFPSLLPYPPLKSGREPVEAILLERG